MARTKEFDQEVALGAAIEVFREHGFAGASASMLTDAMKIGRQSLYDTFGDKWQLYVAAVRRYSLAETAMHLEALRCGPTALDGIRRMIDRVVKNARKPCLGVNSICEFGKEHKELVKAREAAAASFHDGLVAALADARTEGDIPAEIVPEDAAVFLNASIAGIRIAARGGASGDQLRALGRLALRALT